MEKKVVKNSKKIIIGLMGKPGSGKDTFVEILSRLYPDQNIANLRFSDPLKNFCLEAGLKPDRDNLALMARLWVKYIAPDALAMAVKHSLQESPSPIICLNGVRWEADVEMIREVGGHLIFIDTDTRKRYERVTARGEKPGETELSFEQFIAQEQTTNDLQMDILRSQAEITLVNDGTLEDFERQIDDWFATKNTPK
jgi:dephospho-CoA kinase